MMSIKMIDKHDSKLCIKKSLDSQLQMTVTCYHHESLPRARVIYSSVRVKEEEGEGGGGLGG